MQGVGIWLRRGIVGLSLLLCAETITSWIFFSGHPWSSSLQLVSYGPHDFYGPGHGQRHLHLVWIQGEPIGDAEWGWHVSVDAKGLDISPFFSFYEWTIPWWRLILLWLVPPFLFFVPWRSPDYQEKAGWSWMLHGIPEQAVSWRTELRNIAIAHCAASYPVAAVCFVSFFASAYHDIDVRTILIAVGCALLAPALVPLVIAMTIEDSRWGLGIFPIAILSVYFFLLLAVYLWQTNLAVHRRLPLTESPYSADK